MSDREADMDVEATKKMRQPSRLYYCHGSFGNYITGTRPKDDEVLQVFEEVEDDGN